MQLRVNAVVGAEACTSGEGSSVLDIGDNEIQHLGHNSTCSESISDHGQHMLQLH